MKTHDVDPIPGDDQGEAVFALMERLAAGLEAAAEALGSTRESIERAAKAIERLSDNEAV